MDNQKLGFREGDTVKVEACRTNINGTPYWIDLISSDGKKVVLIDDGRPMWDDR